MGISRWLQKAPKIIQKLQCARKYGTHHAKFTTHEWVTHSKYYETFESFTDAIFEFFEKALPENWNTFRDTITDNYRVISIRQYKII